MPKTKIRRCESFGAGYDRESDVCNECGSMCECLREMMLDQERQRSGEKPPITTMIPNRLVAETRITPVEVIRPTVVDGKVVVTMKFDVAWMRKVLGWSLDKDDGGKPKA